MLHGLATDHRAGQHAERRAGDVSGFLAGNAPPGATLLRPVEFLHSSAGVEANVVARKLANGWESEAANAARVQGMQDAEVAPDSRPRPDAGLLSPDDSQESREG